MTTTLEKQPAECVSLSLRGRQFSLSSIRHLGQNVRAHIKKESI